MLTIRVSKCAGFRLGMISTFLFLVIPSMKAADIVITITGQIRGGGGDNIRFFGPSVNMNGRMATIVYTFDDTKGRQLPLKGCPGTASGVAGSGDNSPGKAVVTVDGKSFTYGTQKTSHSRIWREIASSCSQSRILIDVSDDDETKSTPVRTLVSAVLFPRDPRTSLTQNPDWRAPMTTTAMDAGENSTGFSLHLPGTPGYLGVGVILEITSVTITGPSRWQFWK